MSTSEGLSTWSVLGYVLSLLVAWIVYKEIRKYLSPISKIPGPKGLPLLGNMHLFLRRKDHLNMTREWSQQYGSIFKLDPGFGKVRVNVTGPQNIKHVLVTNRHKYEKSKNIRAVIPSIGNGILACSHQDHIRQLRIIGPAFNSSNVREMVAIFQRKADLLLKVWQDKLSDQSSCDICVEEDLTHTTLDVIGECAFGYKFNTQLSGETDVSKNFSTLIESATLRKLLLNRFLPFYKYFDSTTDNARRLTDNTVLKVIRERLTLLEQGSKPQQLDLLDLLLENYKREDTKMDEEELRSQVFNFLLAGHETTAAALTWTLLELAKHPEIQEKVRQEANAVLKDSSDVNWSKLEEMEYIGCVLKESLRLHSPVFSLVRDAVEDDFLDGYLIPKGSLIAVPIQLTHLSPQYWEDPDTFDPERFQGDKVRKIDPYVYLPFGVGTRSCLGSKFAMAEMKTILSRLIKSFSFSKIPGYDVMPNISITVRPKPSLRLHVSRADTTELLN